MNSPFGPVNPELDHAMVRNNCLQFALGLYTNKKGVTDATDEKVLDTAKKFAEFVIGSIPEKPDNVASLRVVGAAADGPTETV